ncbi:hypothetical protein QBC45DRAFT_425491 [Copromyces sp. CBS 386.78]|nr:hypothetical protein QBC45DRAFT_425491 [Copromyces sp. CBS 386.78]
MSRLFPVKGYLHTGEWSSPYDFGIHDDYLTFTPPLLYFLSKTIEGLLNPYQPSTALPASNSNLLRIASPNTCSLTETEERISIYNDRRRSDQVQAALAFLFVALICFAVRAEVKWNRSSLKGRWSYKLEWIKDVNYAPEARTLAPIMVAPHSDYRNVLRSEATRLLAKVALSACLCPIAEYLFCARDTVSERFYSHAMHGNTDGESAHGALVLNGLFMVYLVFRYGTLPCLMTAIASGTIRVSQFSCQELWSQSALRVWDMWIERWIIAHEKENAAAEARYMAVMKDFEPGDWGVDVTDYLPELRPDPSWRDKYQGFGPDGMVTDLHYGMPPYKRDEGRRSL